MKLTDEQQKILDDCDQNLYVSAAPGSGKSTMLSHITGKLLTLDPGYRILLVTFTNKAAKSIVDKCADQDQSRILGGTFHGLSYRLMRQYANRDNYICDESKKRLIIKKLFNCSKDKDKFERIYETISKAKSKYPLRTDLDVLNRYQAELDKYSLLDFDDIIYKGIETFSSSECAFPSITHFLVDELQDTSGPQLELLKVWQSKTNAKMIGVADDDQSIYAWRGARPENVRDFVQYFGCPIYNMGYNFRSNSNIVRHSSSLIRHNVERIQKTIREFKKEPGIVSDYKCQTPFEEIDYVIMRCLQHRKRKIAILYRNRQFKNHLEFEMRKAKLEYTVNDFLEITDRSAIKVMLSILKICTREFDLYDLQNAAKAIKGFGNASVTKLEQGTTDTLPINRVFHFHSQNEKQSKRLKSLIALQDYYRANQDDRLDCLVLEIEKYFNKSFDYADEMRSFLIDIARDYTITGGAIKRLNNELGLNGKEEHNDEGALIELSTVHGYKGLERDIVILPWCQTYLEAKPGKIIKEEEERRLFYVAATRAKEKLYMCYSGHKPQFIQEMGV